MELRGEDLVCYSNRTESAGLRKCPYDHRLGNKACLSDITAKNISKSYTTRWWRKQAGIEITSLSPYVAYIQIYVAPKIVKKNMRRWHRMTIDGKGRLEEMEF